MSSHSTDESRRSFIARSSMALSSLFAPVTLAGQNSVPSRYPSEDTRIKFRPDGTPRPLAGNSVICHLPQESAFRDAVEDCGRALRALSFSTRSLAMLPPESYHLTIFAGPVDAIRTPDAWPGNVASDASMDECNRILAERFASFHLGCEVPFRFRLDIAATLQSRGAITLHMKPADAAEAMKLRTLRDRLAQTYAFRAKDHDRYTFHIGLAYRLAELTRAEEDLLHNLLEEHTAHIMAAAPLLELGLPEYCTFHDMHLFEIQRLLAS